MGPMVSSAVGVLFDVDGTLVDSNYLHALAWWRSLREFGRQLPMFAIHRLVGMGADKLLEELIGDYRHEISDRYSEHFSRLADEIVIFPFARELLREVHGRNAKVVLATSAKQTDLDRLLTIIDAEDAIDHLTSSDDAEQSKPSPDIFETALQVSALSAGAAIAVGDTVWDVQAARDCGMDCVCVETGGTSRCELEEAGAIAVYRDVQDLLSQLDGSPVGALLARATG